MRRKAQIEADLAAAEAELAKIEDRAATSLNMPPWEQVVNEVGGWAAAPSGDDVGEARPVFGILVERIRSLRLGFGRYGAEIEWTPLGARLKALAEKQAAADSRVAAA